MRQQTTKQEAETKTEPGQQRHQHQRQDQDRCRKRSRCEMCMEEQGHESATGVDRDLGLHGFTNSCQHRLIRTRSTWPVCCWLLGFLAFAVTGAHAQESHLRRTNQRELTNKLRQATIENTTATGALEDDPETTVIHVEATSKMDGFTIYHSADPSEIASPLDDGDRPAVGSGGTIQTEGITFFVTNEHETESVEVDSISFWMALPLPTRSLGARLVYRDGNESSDPQFTSTANPWVLLAERDQLTDIKAESNGAGLVTVSKKVFQNTLSIPPKSTVTVFCFVDSYKGLLNVLNTSTSTTSTEGSITVESGSAVSKRSDNGRWVTEADVGFAGLLSYRPPPAPELDEYNKSSGTTVGGGPPLQVNTFTNSAAQTDDIPKSYGVMFDLECRSDDGCLVSSIDIQTTSIELTYVDVYVKKTGYKDGYNSLAAWTQIAAKAPILGHGMDLPTPIPSQYFDAILVGPHTTVGVYITMPDPDMVFHMTPANIGDTVPNDAMEETSFQSLYLHVGESVPYYPLGQPASSLGIPRVFSGVLHYSDLSQVTEVPTPAPTMAPTVALPVAPAAPRFSTEAVLKGPLDGEEQGQGIYFDVVAKTEAAAIDGFQLAIAGNFAPSTGGAEVQGENALRVYYTPGSFVGKEDSTNGASGDWFQVPAAYNSSSLVAPPSAKDGLSRSLQDQINLVYITVSPILLEAGKTGGFYILSPGVPLMFSYGGEETPVGKPWVDNENLEILMGKARSDAGADELQEPRGLNGNVLYTIEKAEEEEVPQDISGDLQTQQKLTIAGMSRRKLYSQMEQGGHPLDDDGIRAYFEELGSRFLDQLLNNGDVPVGITKFMVFPQITSADLTRRRSLQDGSEGEGGDEPELEIYATILGEYSPPPVVDFSMLVEEGFNGMGDNFLADLKEDDPVKGALFAEARSLEAETVSFPIPEEPQEPDDRQMAPRDPGVDLMTWVWVGAAFLALFLLIIMLCLRCQIKKHAKKVKRREEERERAEKEEQRKKEHAEALKAAAEAAQKFRDHQRRYSNTPTSYDAYSTARSRLSSSVPNSRRPSPFGSQYEQRYSAGPNMYYPQSVAPSDGGRSHTPHYPPSYYSGHSQYDEPASTAPGSAYDRISDAELKAQVLNILASHEQEQRRHQNHSPTARAAVPQSVGIDTGYDNVSTMHDPTVMASPVPRHAKESDSMSSTQDETASTSPSLPVAKGSKSKPRRPRNKGVVAPSQSPNPAMDEEPPRASNKKKSSSSNTNTNTNKPRKNKDGEGNEPPRSQQKKRAGRRQSRLSETTET